VWRLAVLEFRLRTPARRQWSAQFGGLPALIDTVHPEQINIRYVPNQSGEKLTTAVKHHLAHEFNKRHSPNTMSVRVLQNADWYVGCM
jgi:hypothetical protein